VILVDDGIATGATITAAAREVRAHNPAKLVLAVPVAPPETVDRLSREVDDLVVLETPEPFFSVGSWYYQFEQTSDEQVMALLEAAESWSYAG
jgi:putative phosphoribosyl transferase